ncbi:hypothetical protein DXG01_000415 [Tephrocybe rancida]|nr:hypothetical protein DXG01_000415 [Tephrocybe rancida]
MSALQLAIPSPSIFLLDCVWDAFEDPSATLTDRSHSLGGPHTLNQALDHIRTGLGPDTNVPHPLTDPESVSSMNLEELGCLVHCWGHLQEKHPTSFPTRSKTSSTLPTEHIPSAWGTGHKAFLTYLHLLSPIISGSASTSATPVDHNIINKVNSNQDRFSPFRDTAPTRTHIISNLYSDVAFLKTDDGFGSAVLHHAIFYGSPFAQTDSGIFTSSGERYWETVIKEARQGHSDSYFICNNIYGHGSMHRTIKNIPTLWNAHLKWTKFQKQNPNYTFFQLYDFLRRGKTFNGVGDLTALLIAGDLAYAGLVDPPTPEAVGAIIHKIDWGAVEGLRRLGLVVGNKPTQAEVVSAFTSLYNYLAEELTDIEKQSMAFGVTMVEHGLCKITRVT